ncbi:MAG TPA: hypothetical protein VIA62_08600 [Thermoanaerobaculia bacterium]|jgi:hypothetical protein|nr:hypothetical protein [Thermoanaerobaculia bacterium]
MEDQRLTDLLRELPREHARPGFTARVLDVLEPLDASRRTAPRRSFRLAPALAAATLVAVAISAGALMELWRGARQHRDAVQARQTLQELRAEHGRLEQELRDMSAPPVVYLGGDEKVDYVLDLGKVRNAEVEMSAPATPVAYHVNTF